jgi:hypothetical protein
MKRLFRRTGERARTPLDSAAVVKPPVDRPAFDAVAYAAALEVLG